MRLHEDMNPFGGSIDVALGVIDKQIRNHPKFPDLMTAHRAKVQHETIGESL
jgi:hypothetical protein